MARVALAVPFYDTRFIRPVLGPRYLESFLGSRGHDVLFLDSGLAGLKSEALAQMILSFEPDLVSLSVSAPGVLSEGLAAARLLRALGFRGHVSVGGYMAAFLHEEILKRHPEIDSAVVGEGEAALAGLARFHSKEARWKELESVAFIEDGRVTLNPSPREPLALDSLPLPFREPGYNPTGDSSFGIQSSRGCLNSCAYCNVPEFYGKDCGWRARSPESVAREAALLKERFSARGLIFYDDNLFGPASEGFDRAFDLAAALERIGGLAIALPASPSEVKRDLFERLKRAGLKQVFLSLESGTGGGLERLGRPHSLKGTKKAVRILEGLEIDIEPGFIMFEPETTLEDLEANIAFLGRLGQATTATLMNRLEVRPGCPLARELEERGRLIKRWPYLDYRSASGDVDEVLNIARRVMDAAAQAEYRYLKLRHESHLLGGPSPGRETVSGMRSKISDALASVFAEIVVYVKKGGDLKGARTMIGRWRERLAGIQTN